MRISEPVRFAPPARSKQMKGILPAPLVAMPQAVCKSCTSWASVAARADRGSVNAATSAEEPISTAEPDRNPVAMKSRRVTGRGWLPSWRMSSWSLWLRGSFLRMIIRSPDVLGAALLPQCRSAAQQRCTGGLGYNSRTVGGRGIRAGSQRSDERIQLRLPTGKSGLSRQVGCDGAADEVGVQAVDHLVALAIGVDRRTEVAATLRGIE